MTNQPGSTLYGDAQVALFLPSRYQEGAPIPPELIEKTAAKISAFLSKQYGGATHVQKALGSYQHDDGRVISETISRIYSAVKRETIADDKKRELLFVLAAEIATELRQESIAVEWGKALFGIDKASVRKATKRIAFSALTRNTQEEFARIALRQVDDIAHIGTLLSLDGWNQASEQIGNDLSLVAAKGGRKAFISANRLDYQRRRQCADLVGERDYVFDKDGQAVRIWMKRGAALSGGRHVLWLQGDRPISRSSVVVTMALLGSKYVDKIENIIDRQSLTKSFFREYQGLRDRIAALLVGQGFQQGDANLEAQILLGRMMFLKFLEQKGWLENDASYLAKRFRVARGDYYARELAPLFFDVLNVPTEKRKKRSPLPFLNGGLFRPARGRDLHLPDSLFDPDVRDSILGTFNRYEFTLEESAAASEVVSIDPSMFGLVLESLSSEGERKTKGIHYTPLVIAQTLAFESIVSRVAERAGIEEKKLREFAKGQMQALTVDEAEHVSGILHAMRILDPAVGSGSLLLAALNELMALKNRCQTRLGQPLIKGKPAYARAVRQFVRESLYGVDIDEDAIEVAKLRLWLAISVGDDEPAPLPDLEHNLRVGDSLSEIRAVEDIEQSELAFDELTKARNLYLDLLNQYKKVGYEEAQALARELEQAEREYVALDLNASDDKVAMRLAEAIRKGGVIPFYWHIHFADVFRAENRGFDVVIANPPYVSAQNLKYSFADTLEDYVRRFPSIQKGAKDIYLAFIEQGLRLAGKSGRLAFINPNFSRSASADNLRQHLGAQGAVDLWVDFGDIQIFETASNYAVLLFARSRKRDRKTFACLKPDSGSWPPEPGVDWVGKLPAVKVSYSSIWRTMSPEEKKLVDALEKKSVPLGQILGEDIKVGVQTSADDVFLMKLEKSAPSGVYALYSEYLEKSVEIEKGLLRMCAKGSAHLKPYQVTSDYFLLWPYDNNNKLLAAGELAKKYPIAWRYLTQSESRLRGREGGKKFDDDRWWRFGRDQGRDACSSSKLLIPSTMNRGMVSYDEKGQVAFTASGKGGGGAYALMPKKDMQVSTRWLLAVLNSDVIWKWLLVEGDPKRGGWRGVDKALITRIPIAVPDRKTQEKAEELTRSIEKKIAQNEAADNEVAELEAIVYRAYGMKSVS